MSYSGRNSVSEIIADVDGNDAFRVPVDTFFRQCFASSLPVVEPPSCYAIRTSQIPTVGIAVAYILGLNVLNEFIRARY